MNGGDIELHDLITDELYKKKSLAAMMWLITQGRELEASYDGQSFFISCSGSSKNVSIWIEKEETPFETIEELVELGEIRGYRIIDVWDKIELGVLF